MHLFLLRFSSALIQQNCLCCLNQLLSHLNCCLCTVSWHFNGRFVHLVLGGWHLKCSTNVSLHYLSPTDQWLCRLAFWTSMWIQTQVVKIFAGRLQIESISFCSVISFVKRIKHHISHYQNCLLECLQKWAEQAAKKSFQGRYLLL